MWAPSQQKLPISVTCVSHLKLHAREGRTELVPGSVYKHFQGLLPV